MKPLHGRSILLIIAVGGLLIFMIAGLPYSRFGWQSALAQSDYTGGGNLTAPPSDLPAFLLDPQTAPAYTDSNGGLANGYIYARIINAAGVGDAGVVARGLVAAAEFQVIGGDPFAPFPTPVRVCVRGVGKAIFIPKLANGAGVASEYPAAPTDSAGETCIFIYQPGTVAIVES